MVVLGLFFIAMILMMVAILSMIRARSMAQVARVNQRLEALAFLAPDQPLQLARPADSLITALSRWMKRVGIQLKPSTALLLIGAIVLSGLVILNTWGTMIALLWWALLCLVSVIIPQVRYRQKINKLVSQIPLFIDQVIRGLVTGRNVEGAIKLATEDLQEPLRDLIDRAQKNVQLGMDLGEALRDAASFYEVKELYMLALAIHTSRVYGGSPRDMLESVVNFIRQREQMQRELRAMTGETRVSALVLGVLPTGIGGYLAMLNPTQVMAMWHDGPGKNMLMIALGLQILGGLLLWRMVKSV
jgi:tight adherence protein B